MSSSVNPTFQYFETHGGEGKLLFKDGCEEDGSALIAGTHRNKFRCIIMEMNSNNVRNLRLLLPKNKYPHVTILQGDSNKEINKILSFIKKYHFSLGFIDPDSPKQLKWSTVETIANHKYKRKKDGFLRRPEMIINFPIEGIKRNAGFLSKIDKYKGAEAYCKVNTDFFGTNKWKEIWKEFSHDNVRSRTNMVDLYCSRLKDYYNFVIPLLFVESINNRPLYHIISCTQHQLGEDFLKKVKSDIVKWQKEDWVRQHLKVHSIDRYTDSDLDQPTLDDY